MEKEIVIENGNKKVRMSEDKYGVYLSVTHNGYQWTSVQVDEQILDMIEGIIAAKRKIGSRSKRENTEL